MKKLIVSLAKDGTAADIHLDGKAIKNFNVEHPAAQVAFYYQAARDQLLNCLDATEDKAKRTYGVQCFLLCATAIEAFQNVYFGLISREQENGSLQALVQSKTTDLNSRLKSFLKSAKLEIDHATDIYQSMKEINSIRKLIVHPRSDIVDMTLTGESQIHFNGMNRNSLLLLEKGDVCRFAYFASLMVPAAVFEADGEGKCERNLSLWTSERFTYSEVAKKLEASRKLYFKAKGEFGL
ncbi:MAG: hypothetical protein EP318_17365 [Rhodobacteraceae bacterium]|nr:MAG: hypothetical protein EP318_17365 [Paracoccaceae bacterium]